MPDIVISGVGGFIGGRLMATAADAGLSAVPYLAFREQATRAHTFVHCANIHDDAAANAAYTADVLATVAGRVERFMQLQTFATLHGAGTRDPGRINLGRRPLLLAPYGSGKLVQEEALCREAARHPALAIRLVYLPVVLGGGSWARVLEQARQHGVVLPARMSGNARANHIDVTDLAHHILTTHDDVAPGIRRTILNRPESAALTWPGFFNEAKSVATENSPAAMLRLAATAGGLLAYAVVSRVKAPRIAPGVIDRRPPHPRQPADIAADDAQGPVRFTGLIQHIVRTQPYIAA